MLMSLGKIERERPEADLGSEKNMRKNAALLGLILLCSAGISFGAITYLIDYRLLYAIAFLALYFMGGLFLPTGKIGTKTHALWIGSSLGSFTAALAILPSVFA